MPDDPDAVAHTPGPGARGAFEPWGATTGIGSLPHDRVDDAIDLTAAACPEVRCRAVKDQISGPVTVAGILRVDGTAALRRPAVVASLARFLARQARWQAEALAVCGPPSRSLSTSPASPSPAASRSRGRPRWSPGARRSSRHAA